MMFVTWLVAVIAGLPLTVFALEVAAGLFSGRREASCDQPGRALVLIPAHDEADSIGATLVALGAVAPPGTVTLVVADNCSDNTAEVARAHGVQVVERREALQGKGYALAFGRDYIAQRPDPLPQTVIVLDADCRLAPGSITALAAACLSGKPAQAVNLIEPHLEAPPIVQISGFAMLVKNFYRSRGMQALGGAALLTGTGMAFPWSLFADAALASGALVEDLALGIAMTRAGLAPRLVERALVTSAPASMANARIQRTRWEHGFVETMYRLAVPTLFAGIRRGSRAEVLLGLHLLVPPLALLLFVSIAALVGLALVGPLARGPFLFLASALATALLAAFAAWLGRGRAWLSGRALLQAPLYVAWKLPIYASLLFNRETRWRRTPREPS